MANGPATHPACCDAHEPIVLRSIDVAPGQPALDRRIGTHARFLAQLLAGLSHHAPTRSLTTRSRDDFAVALLDGWATVADTITFYTERFANEHYAGTATERRSMAELARLIGRSLRPGLAAEVDLAFMMDSTPGAPALLDLAAGTAVQSEPAPGAEPAVFETLRPAQLRPAWNRMRAKASGPQAPHPTGAGTTTIHLAGTSTSIRLGDGVAFRDRAGLERFGLVTSLATVDAVAPTPDDPGRPGRTTITLSGTSRVGTGLAGSVPVGAATGTPGLTGAAAWLDGQQLTAAALDAELAERRLSLDDVEASISGRRTVPGRIVHFATSTALFGASAPQSSSLAAALKQELVAIGNAALTSLVNQHVSGALFPWDSTTAATMPGGGGGRVFLDAPAPTITAGSLVALTEGGEAGIYQVTSAAVEGLADDGVSGKSTRLQLGSAIGLSSFGLRGTAVHGESREITLAELPDPAPIDGTTVELEGHALGLAAGRTVVVTGNAIADPGRTAVHVAELAEVTHDFGPARSTTLTLKSSLPEPLVRESVLVNANVVRASHGQTHSDVLGSGDGRRRFQAFRLTHRPLTYLSAPTASGRTSTLRVFVDDVEWHEVDQLVASGPDDHVFVSRETEAGTIVQFGDGVTGARLPSGSANVRAAYRVGAGAPGRVGSGRLSILAARPAGLRGVSNPSAAQGGAEPESADDARANIAVNVRTIGRVVSLRDHEDFARSFSGVPKALATWSRTGDRRGVIVTVAGEGGAALPAGDPIHDALLEAFAAAGDPLVPVHLVTYQPRRFRVAVDLRVHPDHQPPIVRRAVDAELRSSFAFGRRALGQDVHASEILAAVHRVAGVVAADLTQFGIVTPNGVAAGVPDRLVAAVPSAGLVVAGADPPGAQLLTIEPYPAPLGELP